MITHIAIKQISTFFAVFATDDLVGSITGDTFVYERSFCTSIHILRILLIVDSIGVAHLFAVGPEVDIFTVFTIKQITSCHIFVMLPYIIFVDCFGFYEL